MWIWIGSILIIVFIVLIILVLLSNIHIEASIKTHKAQAEMECRVKFLYGLLHFNYVLPPERFEEIKLQIAAYLKEKVSEQREPKKRGKKGFAYQMEEVMKSAHALRIWDTYDFSMLRITKLMWHTKLGTEEIVTTSVLTGYLYGIKNMLIGWLSYKVKITEGPDLQVYPLWQEKFFLETMMEFQAYIRFFRILKIFHKVCVRLAKAHGGILAWRRDLGK